MHSLRKKPTYSNSKTSSEFVGNGFIRSAAYDHHQGTLNETSPTHSYQTDSSTPKDCYLPPAGSMVYHLRLRVICYVLIKKVSHTLAGTAFPCYTKKWWWNLALPNRKSPRLRSYDYSTPGAYFVTICTHGKRCLFGRIPPNAEGAEANVLLSAMGKIAKECLLDIPSHYTNISVDHWVIMPNHVHILIQIKEEASPRFPRCDIPNIVGKYKASVTRRVGKELLFHEKLWQSSYFDHVIRNREDYARIWNYISGNPSRWLEDTLYSQVWIPSYEMHFCIPKPSASEAAGWMEICGAKLCDHYHSTNREWNSRFRNG